MPRIAVVVAGAGWRAQRFVVPALEAAGVPRDAIAVLRRSDAALAEPLDGALEVHDPESIRDHPVRLTVNCVTAEHMLTVQEVLQRTWPRATHLCDTPILHRREDFARALRLQSRRLHSLEDWPLMPNLRGFRTIARRARRYELRVEHVGIPLHFLAFARGLLSPVRPLGRRVRSEGAAIEVRPRPGALVAHRGPKDFTRAKISFESAAELVEDFHEIEYGPHSEEEVIYRVIDGGRIRYQRGDVLLSSHTIEDRILGGFEPFTDRRNVHELDKLVALVDLFRSLLAGGETRPYPFLSTVRDALTVQRLTERPAVMLR